MIRRALTWLAFPAFVALAQPAFAQQARVQSGEHSTFSRLVFADRADRAWTITRDGTSVKIDFSAGVPDLLLDGVFRWIPRDRLENVTFENGSLRLALGCDCPVDVRQIPSGHIVIDVRDPSGEAKVLADTLVRPPSIMIDAADMPVPILSRLRKAQLERPAQVSSTSAPQTQMATQVRHHPMGRVPLVPDVGAEMRKTEQPQSCTIDDLAQATLSYDPNAAFLDLVARRGALLTGEDTLDQGAIEALAATYLRLGWGAEAVMTMTASIGDHSDVEIIAAALDGYDLSTDTHVDPGCGPGAAVVALLLGVEQDIWARADEVELVAFLDGLSAQRWSHLGKRLTAALTDLRRADLLTGLGPAPSNAPSRPSLATVAAGTDSDAIVAAIDLLSGANSKKAPVDVLFIENARGLRPSVPAGQQRDALDLALVEALVIARRSTTVVEMIRNEQADAEHVLDVALEHLPT